jgi:transposase-like protein
MERRRFTREFKLEAVRLIKDRGVSYARASQELEGASDAAAQLGEGHRVRPVGRLLGVDGDKVMDRRIGGATSAQNRVPSLRIRQQSPSVRRCSSSSFVCPPPAISLRSR